MFESKCGGGGGGGGECRYCNDGDWVMIYSCSGGQIMELLVCVERLFGTEIVDISPQSRVVNWAQQTRPSSDGDTLSAGGYWY